MLLSLPLNSKQDLIRITHSVSMGLLDRNKFSLNHHEVDLFHDYNMLSCFMKIFFQFEKRKKHFRSMKRNPNISNYFNEPSKFLHEVWRSIFCTKTPLPRLETKVLQVIKENPKVIGVTSADTRTFASSCSINSFFRTCKRQQQLVKDYANAGRP